MNCIVDCYMVEIDDLPAKGAEKGLYFSHTIFTDRMAVGADNHRLFVCQVVLLVTNAAVKVT